MQKQLETFNKLEELSNTLFGGLKQKGGLAPIPPRAQTQMVPRQEEYNEETSPNSPGAELLKTTEGVVKGAAKLADSLIPHSVIAEYIDPNLVNKPWSEVAPNLVNNIDQSGQLVANAVKDPRVRAALERAIKVYGDALKSVYKMAEPTVDDLTNKFWKTINDVGVKSARGATNATIDTVSAAVAEVPVVGGLVDLFIAGGKWFNAVASGFIAPTITASGDVAGKAVYTGREMAGIGEKYGSEAAEAYNQLSSALSSVTGGPPPPPPRPRDSGPPKPWEIGHQMDATPPPPPGIRRPPPPPPGINSRPPATRNMFHQMTSSRHGKAANAAMSMGKQAFKTGRSAAKLNEAMEKGSILGVAKHGIGLGLNTAKFAHKQNKASRAIDRARNPQFGGHDAFMFGGKNKASKKRARKTAKRLKRSFERFTRKKK